MTTKKEKLIRMHEVLKEPDFAGPGFISLFVRSAFLNP